MKKIFFSLIFASIVSLFCCSPKLEEQVFENKSLENLITEDFLRNPTKIIAVQGGLFVVVDEFGSEGFIKIFEDDWTLLASLGKLGDGPDEFYDYPSILRGENNEVFVFDGFKNSLFRLDTDSGALSQEPFEVSEMALIEDVIGVTPTHIIYQSGGFQDLFVTQSRNTGNAVSTVPLSIKNSHFQVSGTNKLVFSSNYLAKKPDEAKFAAVFNYYDELIIADETSIVTHEVVFGDLKYDEGTTIIAFTAVAATKDAIYTIYYGKDVLELEEPTTCELLVFDWQGKLQQRLTLDQPLNFLTFDEQKGILYGLNPMNEDNPIYQLDLKSPR